MYPRFCESVAWKSRLLALFCVAVFLICALATHPVAEIGMNDDWSYIKSAQILATTGRIVYNGWAAPILGWQLYLGAAFIKLFGPSFTAIRASTVLVALGTTFMVHRTLSRVGINSRNATIGTLSLVLSPLFLPLALSFMSDVGGLFCVVLCFYACLRSLQAKTDFAVLAWLTFAALSNAVLGTVRQASWLGVLIVVPSTIWLLRSRRYVVMAGVLVCATSVMFIYVSLQWFSKQPFSVIEPLITAKIGTQTLYQAAVQFVGLFFAGVMFLLPVVIAFSRGISMRDRRTTDFLIVGGVLCLTIGLLLLWRDPDTFAVLLAPYAGNYVTRRGMVDTTPIQGTRPVVLSWGIRMVLTWTVLAAILQFVAFLRLGRRTMESSPQQSRLSFNNLLVLAVPFLIGYSMLLIPRALSIIAQLMDRYLLPLLFVAMLIALRLFQDRVQAKLPAVSVILTAVFAVYAVVGTHDAFSLYRAKAKAIAELRAAGVPDLSIDGGFEHNAVTQVEQVGYMNNPLLHGPGIVIVPKSSAFPEHCEPALADRTPVIVPGYALSFDPAACGGLSRFAPVAYRDWLRGRNVNIYIVNTFPRPSGQS